VTQAFGEGVRRVLSAPALLAAVAAASLLFPLHPAIASRRALVGYVVVASFLLGGAIDRYARDRPTRAYGFFGACGRHFAAMLRLAAVEIALCLAADNVPDARIAAALIATIGLLGVYARVRIAVEDRRSALGALLAAARFVRRNPGALAIYAIWTAAIVATGLAARGAAPILVLPLVAAATVFFQSRLAHLRYTAAPPLEWPESPAAEAVASRR
jgi:hypothetical protein